MRKNIKTRRPIVGTVLAVLLGSLCLAATASAAEPFSFLQSPYTQELYGSGPSGGLFGGVAFAKSGNVWVDECFVAGSPLVEFNNAATVSEEGSTLHPQVAGSPFASNAGCGLTNNPDGFLYSNTGSGVVQINASTAAPTGVVFGEPGDALGIATDPQTGNLVYVGANGTILTAAPGGASSTFSTATTGDFVDGIAFDPTGNFLFMSNRTIHKVTVIRRNGEFVQNSEEIPGEPDGIAFHALSPKFVLTNNNDGTMTRLDFPENNYAKPPVNSLFASGGFRGDLTQVGPDGCDYITQEGTRFGNGNTSGNNSIVRICSGFAPPPGVESEITLTPKTATDPVGGEHTVTATVTEEGGKKAVSGADVTFSIAGTNAGVKGTCTNSKGEADPTCETDSTGVVKFTYKDEHGAGEDTIEASVTVNGSTEHATATKLWVAEECTKAIGDGHSGPRPPAGVNSDNNLNTGLTGRQQFEVTFEIKTEHFHLSHLASASCASITEGHEFRGQGTGTLNGVPGYNVSFTISVSGSAPTITLAVIIEKEGKIVYAFTVVMNKHSKQVIS